MATDKNQTDNAVEGEVITGNPSDDFKQRATKFGQEFEALCKKYNCQLVVAPQFRARDDGTFSVVLQQSIGELPRTDR